MSGFNLDAISQDVNVPRGACLLEAMDQVRHDYGRDAVTFDQISMLLATAI